MLLPLLGAMRNLAVLRPGQVARVQLLPLLGAMRNPLLGLGEGSDIALLPLLGAMRNQLHTVARSPT